MKMLAAALILTIPLLQPRSAGAAHVIAASQPMSVFAAFSLCRAHPAAQEHLWVQGWFVPSIAAYRYLEGGLFSSRQAVPNTTDDRWDVNGKWRKYGALYVRITTQAPFGARSLILHGQLDCTSYRFQTDRDPFPPPRLKTVYGTMVDGGTGSVTSWASAGGLKLTLTIPRRAYPRNALTRVIVSIQNVSRHDLGYWNPGVSLPGVASPQAQVLNVSGTIVFPPAMPYMPALPGPPPFLAPLHPGQSLRLREFIVVRGARIRASQTFSPRWSTSVRRALNTLVTQPIAMRLTSEPAPRIVLHASPQGPSVDVVRPSGVGGQLFALTYADCNSPVTFDYSFSWVPSGLHLAPRCSPVKSWHLRVAWLNHPVAVLDYASPQPVPTVTPAPTSQPQLSRQYERRSNLRNPPSSGLTPCCVVPIPADIRDAQ